jgi:hypothetical protein
MSGKFDHLAIMFSLTLTISTNAFPQRPKTAGPATAKNYNNIRFASEFKGVSGTKKQDAAISALSSRPGVIIVPPGTGAGVATTYPNNVSVIDIRQKFDLIGDPVGGLTPGFPARVPLILLQNRLGELTTRPLTGTLTLKKGSDSVRGVGTHFLTELAYAGRAIKLDSDVTTAWAEVASISSDTTATLVTNYEGRGGSGSASYYLTQLGFAVSNILTAGDPNTPAGGEGVGITVSSQRIAGERPMWGANFNIIYNNRTTKDLARAVGMEIDLSNQSASDAVAGTNVERGLMVLSAGAHKPEVGISVTSTSGLANTNSFVRGIWIGNYSNTGQGLHIDGAKNHIYLVPNTDDTDPMVLGRNHMDGATLWSINNDGSARFTGIVGTNKGIASDGSLPIKAGGPNGSITLAPSGSGVISAASFITLHSVTVGALPTPRDENAGQIARVSDSTAVSAEGQTCTGGSSHTALAFSDGIKWKCF